MLAARQSRLLGLQTAGFFVLGALTAWTSANILQTGYWTGLFLTPPTAARLGALLGHWLEAGATSAGQVDRATAASLGVLLAVQAAALFFLGQAGTTVPVPEQLGGVANWGFAFMLHYSFWIAAGAITGALGGIAFVQTRAATDAATLAVAAALAAVGGVLSAPVDTVGPTPSQHR